MKYLLILILVHGNGGTAIDHIEFPTQASCEVAGKAFAAKFDSFMTRTADYVCVVRP